MLNFCGRNYKKNLWYKRPSKAEAGVKNLNTMSRDIAIWPVLWNRII